MNNKRHTERIREVMTIIAIIVLALVLFLVLTANRSGAAFVARSSNDSNLFSAGSLILSNSHEGAIVVNAQDLMPGTSRSGSLTISQSGDYSAAMTLSGLGDGSALSQALTLRIVDSGSGITLWNGAMSSLTSLSLGTFTPAMSKTYQFTVSFPAANATAGLQDSSAQMTLRFTGVAQ